FLYHKISTISKHLVYKEEDAIPKLVSQAHRAHRSFACSRISYHDMKLTFAALVFSAIAISDVAARSGTQNARMDALSPVNQGTRNKAQALRAADRKHSLAAFSK